MNILKFSANNTVTHWVRALQARLLVSRLPSCYGTACCAIPPSRMQSASVEWGFQTTLSSAHGTDCPYLGNLLPSPLQGAPALIGAGCIAGMPHVACIPCNTLARKPVNCVLAPVQSPFLGSSSFIHSARRSFADSFTRRQTFRRR